MALKGLFRTYEKLVRNSRTEDQKTARLEAVPVSFCKVYDIPLNTENYLVQGMTVKTIVA